MKCKEIIREVSDPVMGTALAQFASGLTDRVTDIISSLSTRNVDPAVEKMYLLFIEGFKKAIQANPAMRQKLDTFFAQFVQSSFKKTGIPPVLKNINKTKLVANGKINSIYIKSLFKQALGNMPTASTKVGVDGKI